MPQSRKAAAALLLLAAIGCAGQQQRPRITPRTEALIARAESAERRRQYRRARALYRNAIEAARDDHSRGHAGRKMALALAFWGEYAGAEAMLQKVVRWRPDDVASWHDLGILRHRLGKLDASEAALRRSIRLRPEDPRSRIAVAALLLRRHKYRAALVEYRALLALKLPRRLRDKVAWAIGHLERKLAESAPAGR